MGHPVACHQRFATNKEKVPSLDYSTIRASSNTAYKCGEGIPCHKLVLAAVSPYFRAMFRSGEAGASSVTIHGVDTHTLRTIVTYCYTGQHSTPCNERRRTNSVNRLEGAKFPICF